MNRNGENAIKMQNTPPPKKERKEKRGKDFKFMWHAYTAKTKTRSQAAFNLVKHRNVE